MKYAANIVASFLILSALVSLCVTIYGGFQDSYGFKEQFTANNKSIMQDINDLNIIGNGLNQSLTAVYDITNPTNPRDLLGALASAGIGVVKIVGNIVKLPHDILAIISDYYSIPHIIFILAELMFTCYIGFLLLRKYTGGT